MTKKLPKIWGHANYNTLVLQKGIAIHIPSLQISMRLVILVITKKRFVYDTYY